MHMDSVKVSYASIILGLLWDLDWDNQSGQSSIISHMSYIVYEEWMLELSAMLE